MTASSAARSASGNPIVDLDTGEVIAARALVASNPWTRFRGLMLRQIAKAGFTGVESRIRYERIITPADWDERYEIHAGATFNLSHTLDQMLHLRPRNRFDDLENVYLVGGGTHPGSGLPVIFQSALISSRLLLQDRGWAAEPARSARPASRLLNLEAA